MKTYSNDAMGLKIELYGNIYEFLDTINSRTPSKMFHDTYGRELKDLPSHQESKERTEFTGTRSWQEANDLMMHGYKEGVRLINSASSFTPRGNIRRYETSVVGFAPCIPNAIMGLPDAMISQREHKVAQSEVCILYQITVARNVDQRDIARSARLLLDAINHMEQHGIRVKINLVALMRSGEVFRGVAFTLKEARQPMNLLKMSYPLIHPSFLRRHIFMWEETAPFMLKSFVGGYGRTVNDASLLRRLLTNAGFMQHDDLIITTSALLEMKNAEAILNDFSKQNSKIR